MALSEILLGFDLRVSSEDMPSDWWTEERRNLFLIRPDVRTPLSVDEMVWPSLFAYSPLIENAAASFVDYLPRSIRDARMKIDQATWRQEALWLWDDLQKLEDVRSASHNALVHRGVTIRMTLLELDDVGRDPYWNAVLGGYPREPISDSNGLWELIGYDVADAGTISGLLNCGYDSDELGPLRDTWRQAINGNGLLAAIPEAIEFKHMTDRRVSEHTPFYVYGLYWLSKPGSR